MKRVISIYSSKYNQLRVQLKKSIKDRIENTPYKYLSRIPEILFTGLKGKTLGEYDINNDCILLNSKLASYDYSIILNVALHELAHYITYRYAETPHDGLFKIVCSELGVDNDFEKAKIDITKKEKLIDKINKLQALSESPFTEEGLTALLKISELTAKYNIKNEKEDTICKVELYVAKRIPTKISILGNIVKILSGVTIVNDKTLGVGSKLVAFGSYEELEVAEYLFDSLNYKIEKEIKKAKSKEPMMNNSVTYANGFYLGVLNAINEKQRNIKECQNTKNALVIKNNENLNLAKELYYSQYEINLVSRNRQSNAKYYKESYNKGREYGKDLEIEKGIKKESEQLLLF